MKKITAAVIFTLFMMSAAAVYAQTDGYIIEMDENAPLTLMDGDEDVAALGESGHYYYADDMSALEEYLPYAKNVCENFELELFDYPETTNDSYFRYQWNHPVMKAEALRKAGLDGSGVRVAIIDSGINIAHEDIDTEKIVYTYDCVEKSEDFQAIDDTYGHGTFVAGTIAAKTNNCLGIAGITPNIELALFRVTSGKKLSADDLVISVEKAVNLNCDIINMSLGAPEGKLTDSQINMLSSLVENASENNIIITAAMGNEGDNTINYPAAFDKVIGVGSVGKSLSRSSFSTYNANTFVVAPGEEMYGLHIKGGEKAYQQWKGTSFAVPEVTAAAAAAKQVKKHMTVNEFKQLLTETSRDLGKEGFDEEYGYGLIDYNAIAERLMYWDDSEIKATEIDPLETYAQRVSVEQYVLYNKLHITLKSENGADISGIRLYIPSYSDGRFKGITEYPSVSEWAEREFIVDLPEGNESILLWDGKCTPVTAPVRVNIQQDENK